MDRLLDHLFGPRDFVVILLDAAAFAYPARLVRAGDKVLRTGLRFGKAVRIARRLRLQDEDTPRPIL